VVGNGNAMLVRELDGLFRDVRSHGCKFQPSDQLEREEEEENTGWGKYGMV